MEKGTIKSGCSQRIARLMLVLIPLILVVSACVQKKAGTPEKGLELKGQPSAVDPSMLKPGLQVYYLDGFFRHIGQMPNEDRFFTKGRRGMPVKKLDHRFGKGEVYDSGNTRGIGVQMNGFIHLPEKGQWQFQARANDGIVIHIGGVPVVSDPQWHSDRFSEPAGFTVEAPGWYPFVLRYFQRKGTATLEFYWEPPGKTDFVIVPESVYGHVPEK